MCINTNTIIINIIVVLTGSKLCFTINRLSYHTTGWLLLDKRSGSFELAVWRNGSLVKPVDPHLAKKFPVFMPPESSFRYSHEPTGGRCSESAESSLYFGQTVDIFESTPRFLRLLGRASSWELNKERPNWCHLLYYFII